MIYFAQSLGGGAIKIGFTDRAHGFEWQKLAWPKAAQPVDDAVDVYARSKRT